MKIQYASDIHLEMTMNGYYWTDTKIEPLGDILVLAGDITKLSKLYWDHPFFDNISKDFKQVIIICGNHEYYSINNPTLIQKPNLEIKIRHNVHYYNNKVVKIDDVNFICSTMWSYIPLQSAFAVVNGVQCFNQIKYGRNKITVDNWNNLHNKSKYFILNSLADITDEKTVIVTHHLPTQLCVANEHKNSSINSAFYSELFDIIHDHKIDYWIYGHSHRNIDVEINGTKVISNQFGYVSHNEYLKYTDKYFEI